MESGERAGVIVTHQLDEAVLLADRIVVMSRGPASRIKEIVSVDLPRPRTAEARYSARFGEITSHLAELLDIKGTHGRGVPTTPQGDES
jgi:NitT/TauT family transport system ATP-binding protein